MQQQADATRVEPVFVAPAQKLAHVFTFTSFTLVRHIYMKYVRAASLYSSILLLLGNELSFFTFLLKMTDMAGIIRIAQTLACVISYEKV